MKKFLLATLALGCFTSALANSSLGFGFEQIDVLTQTNLSGINTFLGGLWDFIRDLFRSTCHLTDTCGSI
ncbi:hypothetical protein [Neisseria canis]|uniref:Uncharacterized protein n=2 Tax=Neisseria canis TaxID=493 RepID=A0A3S4P4T7_9NEIS|nr:hypothetical protein [Neisseria canis]VEF01944.1 Uncharacterised protein [Neisseria canis]